MKKQHRILSLILSIILLVTLFSAAVPAAMKYTYAISFNANGGKSAPAKVTKKTTKTSITVVLARGKGYAEEVETEPEAVRCLEEEGCTDSHTYSGAYP